MYGYEMGEQVDFIVRRDELRDCKFVPAVERSEIELGSGQALLEVATFAFTANNITYAAFGEAMSYWAFFPAPDGWGRIPVWGFADVIESKHGSIAEGERVFGYLPMSTHLVVQPDQVTERGFFDSSLHRASLPAGYQQYSRAASDADSEDEDLQALLRPLFMTSFVIEDFLADSDLFGANTIVFASASSKTALGTAFLLSENRPSQCEVVGLTSPGNLEFCNRVGYYDSVLAYDDLGSLAPDTAAVFVDMAGDAKLLSAVHHHFGDLKYSCIVGATHWDAAKVPGELPGPQPQLFFAPTQLQKRREDWGAAGLEQRVTQAWDAFLPSVRGWMKVVHGKGEAAIESVYLEMLDGKVNPEAGHILSLRD
jgi:hypothetical protein